MHHIAWVSCHRDYSSTSFLCLSHPDRAGLRRYPLSSTHCRAYPCGCTSASVPVLVTTSCHYACPPFAIPPTPRYCNLWTVAVLCYASRTCFSLGAAHLQVSPLFLITLCSIACLSFVLVLFMLLTRRMDFIVFFRLSHFLSILSLSYKYHPVLSTKDRTRLSQTLPLKPLRAPDFTATAITATSTATATATLRTSSLPRLLSLTQCILPLVDLRPRLRLSVRDRVTGRGLRLSASTGIGSLCYKVQSRIASVVHRSL